MPQEISLSLEETNKIRTQLELRPIEEKSISHNNVIELSLEETNKLRLSLGLKPIPIEPSSAKPKTIDFKPSKKMDDELLSQKLAKAKVASEKRKLLKTTQGDGGEDDEIDTDNWLSNIGKTQSTKKQKIDKVPSKKQSDLINAHIGHSAQELQNLRNNDILTLQDTELLKDDDDDDEGDILVNEELAANAKVQKNLNERREAEMIKFNGRHYKRNDDDMGGDNLGEVVAKKSVIIKNSSISLKNSESGSNKAESVPQNTTKFSNFFDDLEESPEENTGSQPQIKIKKLKKRKPLDSTKAGTSTRVKVDDFEQLPNIDDSDYDYLQDNFVSISHKQKQQQQAKQKMTPEEIALEIVRNRKVAMERKLEEESMRRQYSTPSENFENVEDLDTVGFLNNLEGNILGENTHEQDATDDDIFDAAETIVNEKDGHCDDGNTLTAQVNGNGTTMEVVRKELKENSTNDSSQKRPQLPKKTNEDIRPKFNTGLADTLKFLKSRSNDNSLQQQTNNSSSSTREELSKQTELLKLKIDIEERILRDKLGKDKHYMKLSKVDREKFFETELDKRLAEKGIIVEATKNKRFNQSNGHKNGSIRKTMANMNTVTSGDNNDDKYATYNPKVELNYKDDEGKALDTKQAYKHLSHKYHGMTTSQRLAKSKKKGEKGKVGAPTTKDEIVD
ncbi:hypothetical protein CORT_0E05280 [Candida orthopsilosis Co 90-125]|uniref:Uncharacterized protein n=1 Tax=Candida orthopsilosis (strain 90-125) TaxID=1136231 RepID=H8X814_CANO9|nr:hypothetical protein CORT_0E05280 [Candida orthopsilosis Co 90-125]CCG24113.1 hypothetical protein CORT_0E05280 [Candida orthopsilosis Co 90-125]